MAKFGWAYIDCTDQGSSGSGSAGPNGSLQFVTESGGQTTGSNHLIYYTGSTGAYGYLPNTVVLSGSLIVTGTVSASTFHIKDITTIDATGSTYFGDSIDDTHRRKGSLIVSGASNYVLSASAITERVWVRGFGGKYASVGGATYNVVADDYIIGCSSSANQTLYLPSASAVGKGALLIIKDEYNNRSAAAVYISGSNPVGGFSVEDKAFYQLNGTMPAVNLYSDGTNWFVF
jgi:hypothetical protein